MAVRLYKLLQELNSILDRRLYGGRGSQYPLMDPPAPNAQGAMIGWYFQHFLRSPIERIADKYGYDVEHSSQSYPDFTLISRDINKSEKIAIEIKSTVKRFFETDDEWDLDPFSVGRYKGSINTPDSTKHTTHKYEDFTHHIALVVAYRHSRDFRGKTPDDAARFGGVLGDVETAAQQRFLCVDRVLGDDLYSPRIGDMEEIRTGTFKESRMAHRWHGERDFELWCRYGDKKKGLSSWAQKRKKHLSEIPVSENPYTDMSPEDRDGTFEILVDELEKDQPASEAVEQVWAILESGYVPTENQIRDLDAISYKLQKDAEERPELQMLALESLEVLLSIYNADDEMLMDMFERVFQYPHLLEQYLLHPTMHRTPKLKQSVIGKLLNKSETMKKKPQYENVIKHLSYDRRWHDRKNSGGFLLELLQKMELDEDKHVLDGLCRGADRWSPLYSQRFLGKLMQIDAPRVAQLFDQNALPYMKDIPADFILEQFSYMSAEMGKSRRAIYDAYADAMPAEKSEEVDRLWDSLTGFSSSSRVQSQLHAQEQGEDMETSKKRKMARLKTG